MGKSYHDKITVRRQDFITLLVISFYLSCSLLYPLKPRASLLNFNPPYCLSGTRMKYR